MYAIVEEHGLERKPFLDKFQDSPEWWVSLEKLLPYFRRVEFAGGEPLMDPQHYRILDMLKPYGDQIELKYATNGTTLGISKGRTVHEYWPHFKSVAVNVSLDGIGDVYNYIRSNSDWLQVVKNIKEIQKIPNITRVVGACTVQISNILVLDKIIECFLDDLGIIFHSHRVEYPNVLSAQVLPKELKDLAYHRLEAVKSRLHRFKLCKDNPQLIEYTLGQIQDNQNYIRARDQSDRWQDCVEFNHKLDHSRNQMSFAAITPEFIDYV
jgi:MoaA/NifB/PqqE/SkfB family radical SAM enzyme